MEVKPFRDAPPQPRDVIQEQNVRVLLSQPLVGPMVVFMGSLPCRATTRSHWSAANTTSAENRPASALPWRTPNPPVSSLLSTRPPPRFEQRIAATLRCLPAVVRDLASHEGRRAVAMSWPSVSRYRLLTLELRRSRVDRTTRGAATRWHRSDGPPGTSR
ncbi:hypothetical protein BDV96DRAFT_329352 [Lophiotrema nucula]|uniref:Uncharacterized protein n=1 Tax=Lophiotrema nucula TaxID=690887 RepID=A0A6A5YK55_9PLEO|nr:hypothetical protein BDV96DRAFT_329352 [Lophiotrema nucula]